MNLKSVEPSGVDDIVQSRHRAAGPDTLRRVWSLLLVLSLLVSYICAAPQPVRADVELTVCASGCGYTSIQSAIDAAVDGDVIKIATGVYSDIHTINGVTQIAYITKTLTLRGGYNQDFSVWNPDTYPTNLDAMGAGRAVYVSGAITVTLDGLHMLNGYHNTTGGGVYVLNANLYLLNSLIADSRVHLDYGYAYGIGLHQSGGALFMQNSTIQENKPLAGSNPGYGGGMYLLNAAVEIRDSFILSNTTVFGGYSNYGRGGGIYLDTSNSLLQGVTFRNNMASSGTQGLGGGLASQGGTLTVTGCIFDRNAAVASALSSQANGTGGGAYLGTANAIVSGNVFTGNVSSYAPSPSGNGGGLYLATTLGVIFSDNLLQNNIARDGGGMAAKGAISLTIENNTFIANHYSGLSLTANGNLANAPTVVTLRGNLFQDNTTNDVGGGAFILGPVNVLYNQFINNHANNQGGGIYQGENGTCWQGSACDNASAIYDGNLLRGNSANEGGALYLKPLSMHGNNLDITYRNMALIDNTATGTGSAFVFWRYSQVPVSFTHLTISGNRGGDGAMIYQVMGRVSFINTILANGTIGIKQHSDRITVTNVLRYNVITPFITSTLGFTDITPLTGNPAFRADGYHLGSLSAAVDAGVNAGVNGDIDQGPRPLGTAPDIGADESSYSTSQNGLQVSLLASKPVWRVYYAGIGTPFSNYLEQEYLIPFAYYASTSAPPVTSYKITDNFPSALSLTQVTNPSDLSYSKVNRVLTWRSVATLNAGEWSWVGMTGRSDTATGGQHITTNGEMTWTLSNGSSYSLTLSAAITVPQRPVFAPILVSPLDGEMCLEAGNQLVAKGVAGAGMEIRLYENDALKATTTSVMSTGAFTLTWTTGLTVTKGVSVYTKACEPGTENCSGSSRVAHLVYPQSDWCPQRSYWEGDAYGRHFIFYFRNDQGRFATDDFTLPGVLGFSNTQMHLFECCEGSGVNPFKVIADGVTYDNPTQNGRMWTFSIGAAHQVTIESKCPAIGGYEPPTKVTFGEVLIDPDGFIFNINQGGGYNAITGMYAPVQALSGMTITAYVWVPEWGEWIQWPADLYGQINPQVTGASGYFAFFTPPGQYYLQVDAGNGYQSWRSPVVTVVDQLVHVNIPLTPQSAGPTARVTLTPEGPQPVLVSVPVGGSVEWLSTLQDGATLEEYQALSINPVLQPRTNGELDPLNNIVGFDGGKLLPGQLYRRKFTAVGEYSYSDGMGHTGIVRVFGPVYLPLVKK